MNAYIEKRKSVRKYKAELLDKEILDKIQCKIDNIQPLFTDVAYSATIVPQKFPPKKHNAPYFLILRGTQSEKGLENVGFIGQQISLYLTELGIGSYFRMGQPENIGNGALPYIICIAFGKPDEPLLREKSEFKRKSLSEISNGNDKRLEYARLAPSGLNAQDWYFSASNGQIHCYRKKPNFLLKAIKNKLNPIDMGIALAHIYETSESFSFEQANFYPIVDGYIYVGTVK